MIRILDKTIANLVQIPRNFSITYDDYTVCLSNKTTSKDFTFTVEDEDTLKDFYQFTLDLSELEDGEYKYEVKHNNFILSTGLMAIGEIEGLEDTTINNTTETFKYYEG